MKVVHHSLYAKAFPSSLELVARFCHLVTQFWQYYILVHYGNRRLFRINQKEYGQTVYKIKMTPGKKISDTNTNMFLATRFLAHNIVM